MCEFALVCGCLYVYVCMQLSVSICINIYTYDGSGFVYIFECIYAKDMADYDIML